MTGTIMTSPIPLTPLTPALLCTWIPVLLLIEGFFSGSEIALLSAEKVALKAQTRRTGTGGAARRARMALELANHPERVLSATLLVTSLCVIGTSCLIALFWLGTGTTRPGLLAILTTSPLVVLFGELIPKTIYQRYADRIAPWTAPVVYSVYWALYPITRLISGYTVRLSRMFGPIEELLTGKKRTTREDLLTVLSFGRRESEIKSSEKRMIKRIFEFKDTEARHALIPLVNVDAISAEGRIGEALESFRRHRDSRMPVYSDRIDNIVGILELPDLPAIGELDQPVRRYVTPAHYVAETQALSGLLLEMQREDNRMVVVVDEYGGAIGILTFEDIVEEIVGEIHDEYDSEQMQYRDLGDESWLVQAKMEIQAIHEILHLEIPEGDYETLGGFLLQQFARIPEPGDELYFDVSGGLLKFTVKKASERQIESVLIQRQERGN